MRFKKARRWVESAENVACTEKKEARNEPLMKLKEEAEEREKERRWAALLLRYKMDAGMDMDREKGDVFR